MISVVDRVNFDMKVFWNKISSCQTTASILCTAYNHA